MFDLSALLSASRDVSDVPVLDERSFRVGAYRDGSVLKFRGLVRDVQDPELVQLGGETRPPPIKASSLIERVPLVVTLFPHVTDWAQRAYCDCSQPTLSDGQCSPSDGQCSESDGRCSESDGPATSTGTKRSSAAVNEQMGNECGGQQMDDLSAKKSKAVVNERAKAEELQEERLLQSQAVHVYVYDGQVKDVPLEAFKVNEAFEFVGILDLTVSGTDLSSDAAVDAASVEQLKELAISDCLAKAQSNDRCSVVLHCCHVSSLTSVHYVCPRESKEFYEHMQQSNDSRVEFCGHEWTKRGQPVDVVAMRTQLVEFLAQTLGGDTLAAEYLLLSLLSHVYARADRSTPLGNLSLNLSLDKLMMDEEKRGLVARLEETLALLMPMVARVDLSLEALNSSLFQPHKDYDREMLVSGVLQVAHGTTMLVDETALTPGQLNDRGVKNVSALQSLIEKMLLPYDFHYYSMDFPQDVTVVTVSEGSTILPVTVAVPVSRTNSTNATDNQPSALPKEQLLECFRLFLSVLRSFAVTIRNEEAEMAEKHYVECRKSQQKVVLEDLHRWLRLARLMALSRGEGNISKDSWDAMMILETERLARHATDKSD